MNTIVLKDDVKAASYLQMGMGYFQVASSIYQGYGMATQYLSWLPGQEFFESDQTKILKKLDTIINKLDIMDKEINSRFDKVELLFGDVLDNQYQQTQLSFFDRYHILKQAFNELDGILGSEQYISIRDNYIIGDGVISNENLIQKQVAAIHETMELNAVLLENNSDYKTETLKTYFEKTGPKVIYTEYQSYLDYAAIQFKILKRALDIKIPYYPPENKQWTNGAPKYGIAKSQRAEYMYNLYIQYQLALSMSFNYNLIKLSAGYACNNYTNINVMVKYYNSALHELVSLYKLYVIYDWTGCGIPFLINFPYFAPDYYPDDMTAFVSHRKNVKIKPLSPEEEFSILHDDTLTPTLQSAMDKLWGTNGWASLQRLYVNVVYQDKLIRHSIIDNTNFSVKGEYNHCLYETQELGHRNFQLFDKVMFNTEIILNKPVL
jgi:hypothetical protein